jgi:hypothetical protein
MTRKGLKFSNVLMSVLLLIAVILYFGFAFLNSGSTYQKDQFLANSTTEKSSISLDINATNVDINEGVLYFTATPRLSGEFGQSTSNGSFFQLPVVYSFDVFSGETLLNPGAGNLTGGQPLGIRIEGDPNNYPFDQYEGKFFVSTRLDQSNSDVSPLDVNDVSTALAGFSAKVRYLSFNSESPNASEIRYDISQGFALVEWKISRGFSSIFASFLLGGLMLVGAMSSVLLTHAILRRRRPPSLNSLVWLAAFLFALFQVRSQLPGSPPSGVRFDMLIFFPTVLLLTTLILINVNLWINREDWDMENTNYAVAGRTN